MQGCEHDTVRLAAALARVEQGCQALDLTRESCLPADEQRRECGIPGMIGHAVRIESRFRKRAHRHVQKATPQVVAKVAQHLGLAHRCAQPLRESPLRLVGF